MRQNLNPYNPVQFKKQFESTEIYHSVAEDFDNIWWDQKIKFFDSLTPRHAVSSQTRGFSMIPFYYLQPLLEKNPTSIYDLGCGANMFKKYIPNIIGVGRSGDQVCYPDIEDQVDIEYVNAHQNYFESVFSINALHFRPLSELQLICKEFISMVAPGGRGFLSLNLQRMVEKETKVIHELVVNNKADYEHYVRTQMDNLPCKYLIFDVNLDPRNEWLDGNIRLVFEK
jgi:SAM-dependent methyltransferase